ncbi:MAG: peptide chain release factor H [Pseudomonadota bacterium]
MKNSPETRLLISSGEGPLECRRALSHVMEAMAQEAEALNVGVFVETGLADKTGDPASALVSLTGANSDEVAERWIGTIQWVCKSPFRPNHKRCNWFVGVFRLPEPNTLACTLDEADVSITTFRAGGPGGQHQNTTNSAVRATHEPSGLSAISRDERSQHRNKQTALRRLLDKMLLTQSNALSNESAQIAGLHKQLERGNPVRCFKGRRFREVKRL